MTSPQPGELSRLQFWSRRATFALLVVFVAEVAVGSSGRWLVLGPLSIRQLLFAALLTVSVPLLWRQRRYLARQTMLWVCVAFLLALGLSALWGNHLGNATQFIAADLTAFSALLLVAPVLALQPTRAETHRIISVLFWSSVALAAFTLVIHVLVPLHAVNPGVLAEWLTERSLGGLADVAGGVHRIYLRSQILFIPVLLIGLHRLSTAQRHRTAYLIGTSLVAMGLVLSLTRAFWLGAGAALAVLLVLSGRDTGRLLRSVGLALSGLAVLVALSVAAYRGPALIVAAADRLSPGLIVVLPPDESPAGHNSGEVLVGAPTSTGSQPGATQPTSTPTTTPAPEPSTIDDPDAAAVEIRSRSLELSKERIRERPLTGWGLGYNFDEIRQDGRTEYMYWDLLVKLGVPGLALFLLLYAWTPVRTLIRRTPGRSATASATLSASLAGLAVTSYFNPFLNSTLGIVVLLVLVAVAQSEQEPDPTTGGPGQPA